MAKDGFLRATRRLRNRRQAYVLTLLGAVLLILAWLLHPDPGVYPIGVLLLGLVLLLSLIVNPYRLGIAACLATALGAAVYLVFRGLASALPAYILAIGIGLLAIALLGRRGYIGKGALSPAIIVIGVGIVEYLLTKNTLPGGFIPFVLSLWFPGIVLLVLGLLYGLLSARV